MAITTAEAGRLGGRAVLKKYGKEYFKWIRSKLRPKKKQKTAQK